MKNKKNYILFAMAIIVWGYTAFSFFGTFGSGENHRVVLKPGSSNLNNDGSLKEDTFLLLANYKDPFLGKVSGQSRIMAGSKVVKVKKKEAAIKVPESPVDLSFISFVGLVRNQGNNKKVALVSIYNNQHMASEGEIISDVLFLKNAKDSIGIVYKDKTYYLKRKQNG